MNLVVRNPRFVVYLLNFVFVLQLAGAMYFNTTFLLSRHIGGAEIGFVFALSFFATSAFMLIAPSLIQHFGNFTVFTVASFTTAVLSFLLAHIADPSTAIALFIGISSLLLLLYFSLDIFLENVTENASTGGTRALFLTVGNTAFLIAPTIVGFIIDRGTLNDLYIFVSICMLIVSLIAALFLSKFKDPPYKEVHWAKLIASLNTRPNLKKVFVAQFMLRFFYAIMVVYLPLYLLARFGFTFTQLGVALSAMLIPFILLEIPLGKMGDKKFGEKEILIGGFLFMALTTALIPFIATSSILLWGFALFCTRIGAAMVDIGSESYFFKSISAENAGEVSLFRIMYPLAYGVGPLVGGLALFFLPLPYIFLLLSLCMLIPLPGLFTLKDSK